MLWQPSEACNFYNTNIIEVKHCLDEFQQLKTKKGVFGLMLKKCKIWLLSFVPAAWGQCRLCNLVRWRSLNQSGCFLTCAKRTAAHSRRCRCSKQKSLKNFWRVSLSSSVSGATAEPRRAVKVILLVANQRSGMLCIFILFFYEVYKLQPKNKHNQDIFWHREPKTEH